MEDIWLAYAKRLQALASTGASFTQDAYDRERYDEIARIATEMLAQLGNVPLGRIDDLVGPYATGYVTPKVDVRAVIFDGARILLVREASDGKWALPGGFAEVGLTPAESTAKEVREEAGLEVDVLRLIGLRHKPKEASEPDIRDFYKLFFRCSPVGQQEPARDPAITGYAFFDRGSLPALSTGRRSIGDINMAYDDLENPARAARFH